jgi:Spy/CpxP family protein refolding chaperone
MYNKLLKLNIVAVALLLTGLGATAQPGPGERPIRRGSPDSPRSERPFQPGGGPNAQMGGFGSGMFQALAVLNPEQRESFREQMRKEGEQLRGSDQKLQQARREMMKAAFAEKFNEREVRKHAAAVAKIEADRTVQMAKILSRVEPPLSSEQRERLQNPPRPGDFQQRRGGFPREGSPPRERGEQPRGPEGRRF